MAETNINIYLHDGEDSNPTSPKDPGTTPQPEDPTQNKGEQGKVLHQMHSLPRARTGASRPTIGM